MSDKKTDPKHQKAELSSADDGFEEMPTVTTLLQRKKLRLPHSAGSPPPPPPSEVPLIAQPKIRPSASERRRELRLEVWTPELLQQASASEMRAINLLFSAGLEWVVVFIRQDGEEETYLARAVAGSSRDRWAQWTGVVWRRSTSPKIWDELRRKGVLAISSKDAESSQLLSILGCRARENAWALCTGDTENPIGIFFAGGKIDSLDAEILQKAIRCLR